MYPNESGAPFNLHVNMSFSRGITMISSQKISNIEALI